jgi:hypothetical protein
MQPGKPLSSLALSAAVAASQLAPEPPVARRLSRMSCEELWYARTGNCFRTEQARAVFGRGCFSPYGRLCGWEKERVMQIQMWEARKGC